MSTLSAGNLVSLRTAQGRATPYLSVLQPVTLLTALVNNASITRGARTINFDTGTGGGFGYILEGQTLEVDTAGGTKKTFVKSVSGTQTAGTIELYENGILWADNQVLRIKHLYEPHPVPPAIRSGSFFKFYDLAYSNQNSQPNPVVIMGSHRAGKLTAGSIVFNLNSTFSYAVASGATISSRVWSCVHNGGGTSGISFSSTTAANPTLTITEEDEYWLSCAVTDSNGKVSISHRAIFTNPPYVDFTIQSFSGDWQSGGWKVSLQATGAVTLTDFPDNALAVLWYENTFNGVSGFVNLWTVSDEVLTCGYLRQDNDNDDFDKGTGQVTFQISTIDDLLNNIAELGSVSLNAVTTPAVWYEYASWMTVGRSVHHLMLWQSWGVFQCADVYGLTANALGVKTTDYSEASLLQQVNGFAHDRGIFAKLISDRLGRLHLVQDSQMLSDAARGALDTVSTITEADVSGTVDVARNPEGSTTFTQLDGFSFDGTTSIPFISIVPGYRESSISYIMPEERGGSTASVSNQVLADQTDSNVRVGRYHATQNNNPRELRFSNPYNGLGAFDVVPNIGWYVWGIASATLKRGTALFGRKMICRHIDVRFNHQAGTIFTDVVLEPEAVGPAGIQGNYPLGYPAAGTGAPEPDWTPPFAPLIPGFGYFPGGFVGGNYIAETDRITFSTGVTADFNSADITNAKTTMGCVSDRMVYGYFSGGLGTSSTYFDDTDRLVLATGVAAAYATAVLTFAKESMFSLSAASQGYGYYAGGVDASNTSVDDTDRLNYSTGVISNSPTADLNAVRASGSTISNGLTAGYCFGGSNGIGNYQATCNKLTFSSGVMANFATGNLAEARVYAGALFAGATYGYIAGGTDGVGNKSTAERFTIATEVCALNAVSDLPTARTGLSAVSDGSTNGYFVVDDFGARIVFSTGVTSTHANAVMSQVKSYAGGMSDGAA